MTSNRRLTILAAVLVALAAVAISIFLWPQEKAVGLQPASINYPMMYAMEEGFIEEVEGDLEVQVFGSANNALDALLSNDIVFDAAIPLQNVVETERDNPNSLGIAAFVISDEEHPIDYLIAPSGSSIKAPSDLAGKTVVVFRGAYSETLTRITLEKLGITNVSFIKRSPGDMAQALRTGEADAGVFYNPVATQAVEEGWGRVIESAFWEKNLTPSLIVGVYTYRVPSVEENPKMMRQLISNVQNATIEARKNPTEAKKATRAYLGGFDDNVLSQIPDARVVLPSEIDPAIYRQTMQLYEEEGLVQEIVDLEELVHRPWEGEVIQRPSSSDSVQSSAAGNSESSR
jgi:ABC-type nitrate/sulfonate/bicarbonate transport system substrate-binding protein